MQYVEFVRKHVLLFVDLQTINITLRILYRPQAEFLPKIFSNLGLDYEERVLPSITNEVLKSVVVSGSRRVSLDCYSMIFLGSIRCN